MGYGAWVRVRVRVRARDTPPAPMYPQQSRVELMTAILRLAFCFLLFQHKPMATRPLLVVCTLATRFPLKMQARPAMSGLKDAPSREVYGVHGAAAWGCGSHLSNEPSVPKGSVRCRAPSAKMRAPYWRRPRCRVNQPTLRCATTRRSSLAGPQPHQIHGTAAWHRIGGVLGDNQPTQGPYKVTINAQCRARHGVSFQVSFTSH